MSRKIWKESIIEVIASLAQSFRFGLLIGLFAGIGMMYYYSSPRMIERRAQDLGILRYNAKEDNFTVKDTIILDDYEWRYLRNGSFSRDFRK